MFFFFIIQFVLRFTINWTSMFFISLLRSINIDLSLFLRQIISIRWRWGVMGWFPYNVVMVDASKEKISSKTYRIIKCLSKNIHKKKKNPRFSAIRSIRLFDTRKTQKSRRNFSRFTRVHNAMNKIFASAS